MPGSFQGFFSSATEAGLAELILDAALKGTVVLVAAALCAMLLGRASAALRHFVWCLAFTALALLPIFSIALPSWQVPGLRGVVSSWMESFPTEPAPTGIDPSAASQTQAAVEARGGAEDSSVAVFPARSSNTPPTSVTVSNSPEPTLPVRSYSWRPAVSRIWFLGVCAALAPLAAGMLAQRWLSRRVLQLNDLAWTEPLEELRSYFRIWRRVTLCVGTRPIVPLTLGVVQPVVVIPSQGRDWHPERRRVVLMHELAHVSRHDVLTQIFAQAICALYWFHPLVWIAARRMRIERETACDDRVLNAGIRPSTYAQHLLEIACLSRRRLLPATASVGMSSGSKLEWRVTTILDTRRDRGPLSLSTIAMGAVASFLTAAALASASLGEAKNAEPRTPAIEKSEANAAESLRYPRRRSATIEVDSDSAQQPRALPGFLSEPLHDQKLGRWQMITSAPRGSIWAVDWSHDGRRIAFGEGANVRICEAESLRTERILVGHTGKITCIRFSTDDRNIASSSADGTVRIWSIDGTPGRVLNAHTEGIRSVAWNPNGREIVAGGTDGRLRIWNVDGTKSADFEAGGAAVNAVAWSPDGMHLASGGEDRAVQLWSPTGAPGAVMEGHAGAVLSISWSPDSRRLASSDFGFDPGDSGEEHHSSVRLWNIDGRPGRVFMGKNNGQTTSVAWSPDGKWIAAGGWNGQLRLYSAVGSQTRQLEGSSFCMYSIAWSPDSRRIVSGNQQLNGRMPAQLLVWNVDGRPSRGIRTGGDQVFDVEWNPSGNRFAAACRDGKVRIWSDDAKLIQTLRFGQYEVHSVAWSPDGAFLAAVGRDDMTLRIWSTDSWAAVRVIKENQTLRAVDWSADGRQLIVASDNNAVLLFDVSTGNKRELSGHLHGVSTVQWSPRGDRFASGSFDSTLRIWEADGSAGPVLEDFGSPNRTIAWSPDGNRLVAGREDNRLRIWQADGTAGPSLVGHEGYVQSAAWSPDGRRIASGSWDNTVRLWSAQGRPEGVLGGHGASVFAVDWHPDSQRLLTAGFDGTIRSWNASTGKCDFSVVLRDDGESATLDSHGTLLSGVESVVETEFVYLVENPSGAFEVMNFDEFRRRTGYEERAERSSVPLPKGRQSQIANPVGQPPVR
ncbi:MAG: M56 family metallopeptidase [Planctomycetaceae bacterium]